MAIIMAMKAMILKITPEILRLIAEVDEFKGQWQGLKELAPDRLVALKRVATIESVGSSTRIEGVKLTDAEIGALLSGLKIQPFGSRDEEEVAGYAALMEMVFESFGGIPLDEDHIKQLHRVLLKYSSKDVRHLGEYKKFPNRVEVFDEEGKSLGVIFEPASPFETPSRMKELLEWFNDEENVKDLHPLLRISVFVIWFLAIHPFQDGNGRLARALTTLLLLQNGYAYVPFSSLERIVEENKDRYYQF
ncbi:MAG TPA: Fic family protein, partial [Bdellovibrionota bacterium]|nr:Fic family protein [Bdellovibrionota bacterium]